MELRLLISEAAKSGCIPKTADFKQAFCQSVLLQNEKYVLSPPHGCLLTPAVEKKPIWSQMITQTLV